MLAWLNGKLLVALLVERVLAEAVFPLRSKNLQRSIWREVKFIFNVLVSNLISLEDVIENFSLISSGLSVEKRANGRKLQLISVLS